MVIIEFLYKRFRKRAYTGLVNSQMNESPVAVWRKRIESETFRNLWKIHVIRIYAILFMQYGLMQIYAFLTFKSPLVTFNALPVCKLPVCKLF